MDSAGLPFFGYTITSLVAAAFATLVLSFVIFLAAIGKSFGVRQLYIKVLLLIFEWGRIRIEKHDSRRRSINEDDDDDEIQEASSSAESLRSNGSLHRNGDSGQLIERAITMDSDGFHLANRRSLEDMRKGFQLEDSFFFCKSGIEAMIEDGVTERFDAAELSSWNLLTRSNTKHEFISLRLTLLWVFGFIVRYLILFPFRAILALFAIGLMIVGTAVIGNLPSGPFKKWCNYRLSVTCYRIMSRAFSAVITFHNKENRANGGGICVANHTSPIDIIILGCDNCYAMVGQAQGGFMGLIQRAMSRADHHIWFQRSESKDRLAVAKRLKEHVEDTNKLPILIFPEGTCINNTSIMMFKKGSFEVGGTIYPVAIKYDPLFADPFWNSGKQSLSKHLIMILTSWALVCDVWYLPPETQKPDETGLEFANRIKAEIAQRGGLVDLEWDGGLKRDKPKPQMKLKQQEEYSKLLKAD